MDSEKLPSSFDVVVIGTGLPEAMVAASLSRIGKTVLHIDRNDYYGGQWATFTFESLLKWSEDVKSQMLTSSVLGVENGDEVSVRIPLAGSSICNIEIRSFIPDFNLPPAIEVEKSNENQQSNAEKEKENLNTESLEQPDEITVLPSEEQGENSLESEIKTTDEDGQQIAVMEGSNPDEIVVFQEEGKGLREECKNENGDKIEDSVSKYKTTLNQAKQSSIISQAKVKQNSRDISLEDLKILSRKFNLDINPKFLFSAGPLVNAILKANISHYSEFQIVNRILTCKGREIIEVPCNRSDIFSSTFLSMIEKRTLMKFLTLCLDYDSNAPSEELIDYLEKPFLEFLKSRRLSENLQKFIIYSIAMVKPTTLTSHGLKETCFFLKSLGRYGKSPFIWPLYGVGELPQAFCRMSAVFGCLYCLSKQASAIHIDNDKCTKVIIGEEEIECKYIVTNRNYLPLQYFNRESELLKVSKAILITDASILPSDTEFISFLTIPPLEGREELVRVIELGPAASACPSGLFVLYLSCYATESALLDLESYVELLTAPKEEQTSTKPKLLWSIYFNEIENNSDILEVPENLFITSMPGNSLGFKGAVENAENIFKKICPEEEFLMAVPNAEDILWDTEPNETTSEESKDVGNTDTAVDEARDLMEIKEIEEPAEDRSGTS